MADARPAESKGRKPYTTRYSQRDRAIEGGSLMGNQTLRDDRSSKPVEIVEERGSFLLVRAASGFAVVERRNGRIYPISPGKREGVPMTGEAIAILLSDQGCLPENEARRLFDELCEWGERFAQSLR
jgi:hypothetical protein